MRVHWPLGYSGPESPGRQEGLPDPAAWAHRSTPMPANASCAVGQETLGNTVRMPLARPQRRRQESPCSRTHGPSGAGLPCGRLVWPPCIRRNPAPLWRAGELWRAPGPEGSPGQAGVSTHEATPTFPISANRQDVKIPLIAKV